MSDATRTILVVVGVVVGVFILLPLLWGGGMMGGMMGPSMMGGWNTGWGGGVGVIFMVFFWVLLIGGGVLLVKWIADTATTGRSGSQTGESAMDILKRRYASGEITKTEFEQAKKDIA